MFVYLNFSTFTILKFSYITVLQDKYLQESMQPSVILFSFTLVFAQSERVKRIIDGNDAPPGKWPFYAFLQIEFDKTNKIFHDCGSVILSRAWVLSAAHCTAGVASKNILVFAGFPDSTLSGYQQRSEVVSKHEHPRFYKKYLRHDIVMLRLKTLLNFNSLTRPIALPGDKENVVADFTRCHIIGFGMTRPHFEPKNYPKKRRILQQAEISIAPLNGCRERFGGQFVDQSNVCVDDPGTRRGICQGDSGGPLACHDDEKYVVRGVASFVKAGCGDPPDVFTRVSFHLDWIREKMECGEWKVGVCGVSCGEGTRRDTRICHVTDVSHHLLNRISICRMPDCPGGLLISTRQVLIFQVKFYQFYLGEDFCKDLFCSPNAECRKNSGKFQCECLPGFYKEGTDCIIKNKTIEFKLYNGN